MVSTVLANLREIQSVLRFAPVVAALMLVAGAFVIGFLLGTSSRAAREVLGLGTAQRNVAAATVVAAEALDDPSIVAMVIVTSLVGFAVLFPVAGWLRKRGDLPGPGRGRTTIDPEQKGRDPWRGAVRNR